MKLYNLFNQPCIGLSTNNYFKQPLVYAGDHQLDVKFTTQKVDVVLGMSKKMYEVLKEANFILSSLEAKMQTAGHVPDELKAVRSNLAGLVFDISNLEV